MRMVVFFCVILSLPVAAEEIWLTCKVTEIAAMTSEGSVDAKLKKMAKFLQKSESLAKYRSYKFVAKKSLNATHIKAGSVKLKNGARLSVKAIGVDRAHKQNTVTVEVALGDASAERKSFIDREYLFLPAGEFKAGSELIAAVQCPVFP